MIFLFISGAEIVFIFFIILMIFGADKIPDIAKGMAKGIKKVKDATQEIKTEIKKSAEKKGVDTDSISKEINKLVDGPIEIYACGGGIYNTTLLNNLEGFLDHKIQSTNILGVDPDYLEAMTFAWLARNAIRRIKTKVFTSKGLVYGYLGSITEIR